MPLFVVAFVAVSTPILPGRVARIPDRADERDWVLGYVRPFEPFQEPYPRHNPVEFRFNL